MFPLLPDEDGSKVNACVGEVYRIWSETADQKSAQLLFCDLSTPKSDGSFNVYDDIRKKLIARGIPADEIGRLWGLGSVIDCKPLRKNNYYLDENGNKVDHGQDYTALANYLHGHWRKEFGGHRYKASRSCVRPEPEPATEAVRDYSLTRPPVAPRGYILVESRATQYGFLYFKYVWDPKNETHKRTGSRLL